MSRDALHQLIERWRADPDGTYRTWFLWEERLKNFRSIRRGITQVVDEIHGGTFGTAYRGSSLETVVGSIAEQRQMFRGADHAFLWKPKLRMPDIYEDPLHQRAFGAFLNTCMCCHTERSVLEAIHRLDAHGIKGLGPAAANLLYFLHPTIVAPFNTAIVKGYNAVSGARVRLGRWNEYLAMRAGLMSLNARYRPLLSNDLGAVAAFLFDVGSGRYPAPPRHDDDVAARAAWERDLQAQRTDSAQAARARREASEGDRTHTEIQGWLRDLGLALGFDVWIAANDRGRSYGGGALSDGCLRALPDVVNRMPGIDAVRLIDVLWLRGSREETLPGVVAAFEVEHSTSIYSGIVRLLDLALGAEGDALHGMFLVAPDDREAAVRAQLARPAFRRIDQLAVRFLPYSALTTHREHMARFGSDLKAVHAIARSLV